MTEDDATIAVIDALEELAIPYMIVGSLSSNFYGEPRSTRDADFVIQAGAHLVLDLHQRLPSGIKLDRQMSFEGVTGTSRFILRVASLPFSVELFLLGDDEYDQTRFARRIRTPLLGRVAYLPTAEDVIVTKLYRVACARGAWAWHPAPSLACASG